jgi:sigma-B regulation protein RsbU (phosphoserine phosphatase)
MNPSSPPREHLEQEIEQLRRAVSELSMLNEIATHIGASRNAGDIVDRLIHSSMRAVGAEQGMIVLVDRDAVDIGKTLVRSATTSIHGREFHLNEHLVGWLQINKKPLLIQHPPSDRRFPGVTWDADCRNILAVPMLVKSELIGIIATYNKHEEQGFTGEDQRLLSIIASQSAQVIENARLHEEEKRLARLQRDMELAAQIQADLLPKAPPRLEGYEISGVSLPAQIVEGDYFDFIPLENGRLAFAVGDVAGKGVSASLYMAVCRTLLRAEAHRAESPSRCLEVVNRGLCMQNESGMFMTLFYAVLDPADGSIDYANAGHNLPFLLRPGIDPEEVNDARGTALGMLEESLYTDGTLRLAPGECFTMYTDGIIDTVNEKEEEFGETRLREILRRPLSGPLEEFHGSILDAVKRHQGSRERFDDVTLVSVKRIR